MISRFGGATQIRDLGLIESAVARPRAGFGGESLYHSLAEKAAVMGYSLCKNHGFADGNKRVAAGAVDMFLLRNGHVPDITNEERVEVYLKIAASEMSEAEFVAWIRSKLIRRR